MNSKKISVSSNGTMSARKERITVGNNDDDDTASSGLITHFFFVL